MNLIDVAFQVFCFVFLFAFIFSIYFAIKFLVTRNSQSSHSKSIDEKLDKIIELLEKNNKD